MWKLANPEHWPSLVQMSEFLYIEDPSQAPAENRSMQRTLEELHKNPVRGRAVVCLQNGAPVGYALLISFWSNEYGGELCFIDELYTKAEARGQGIASDLMKQLMSGPNSLWEGHAPALVLEVTPTNTRARELYSKLGFKPASNGHMIFRKM